MKISVIVTNFNGIKLLKKNLEKILLTSYPADEFILADDASTDNSLKFVRNLSSKYPQLKILSHKSNVGFARNSNDAVSMAQGDFVVLLNNDIVPQKNYLQPSLRHFSNPKVMAVGFAEEGHPNYARIFWKSGYLQHGPGHSSKAHISAWFSGGSSIVRKSIFKKLGGFDPIYAPFYSEDLDLGYRAWKSGYQILWEPQSMVEHRHEATISKFPKRFLDFVKERNRLLSVWRNITDPQLLKQNRLALIGRVFFGPNYIKIIRAAKRQVHHFPPPIVFPKLTDRQIFAKFTHGQN